MSRIVESMNRTAPFQLVSPHRPSGDQPRAIAELTEGLACRDRHQVLLGATGTGKRTWSVRPCGGIVVV